MESICKTLYLYKRYSLTKKLYFSVSENFKKLDAVSIVKLIKSNVKSLIVIYSESLTILVKRLLILFAMI